MIEPKLPLSLSLSCPHFPSDMLPLTAILTRPWLVVNGTLFVCRMLRHSNLKRPSFLLEGRSIRSEVPKAQTLESQKKHEHSLGIVGAFHTSWSQSVALTMPPTPRDVGFCSPTWVFESGKPQQASREPVTSAALAPAALSSVASCINC